MYATFVALVAIDGTGRSFRYYKALTLVVIVTCFLAQFSNEQQLFCFG
jgi:hypothetical protein